MPIKESVIIAQGNPSTKKLVSYICDMSDTEINSAIVECLLKYNPERIAIFGSYARGEQTEDSDLDILVSFRNLFGLLKLVHIERELSAKLGRKVDLVTERAIKNDKIRQYIAEDMQVIYP